MAGGRDAVKLSDDEVQALLGENLKVQVASNGPDGVPHLTTLFYIVRDGKIAFWTYGRSQKILNLERDPRVSALVEDGTDYFELRGVSIKGKAEIVRDYDAIYSHRLRGRDPDGGRGVVRGAGRLRPRDRRETGDRSASA